MNDPELLEAFLTECGEHLATVEDEVLAWEQGAADVETVNHLFRALHTVKGGSGLLGLRKITTLAHHLENVMGRIRSGVITPDHQVAEALLHGVDKLRQLLDRIGDDSLSIDEETDLLRRVSDGATNVQPPGDAAIEDEGPGPEPARPQPAEDAPRSRPAPRPTVTAIAPEASVRISLPLLDSLMNLASELVLVRNQNNQAIELHDMQQLSAIAQRLNVVTSELQAKIMQTRMRPVGVVFTKFNRLVRDLALSLGKEVELEITGSEVELDKNIIEAINDPLTHLVRNAVDHGLEPPDERASAGKPRVGKLLLGAYHQAGQVNIRITDDGRGMDPDVLKEAALHRGMINREQAAAMTTRDAFDLIFRPGFSMAREVSDLSGRGVGMDVVQSTLKNLSGVIDIASEVGRGTTFTIKLPLTLAIVPALIVAVEGTCFAIHQINIEEVVWLHGQDVYQMIQRVDQQEVYWLRGKLLPILRLADVLGMEPTYQANGEDEPRSDRRRGESNRRVSQPDTEADERRDGRVDRRTSPRNSVYVVVVKLGSERFGLVVDTVIDTEEIVVKPLHAQLEGCGTFAGTAVLGDGRIAMVLDIAALVELSAPRLTKDEAPVVASSSSMRNQQTILLFDIGGRETFAVPLSLIARVEEVSAERIQWANDRGYLDFRESIMPLVHIEEVDPSFRSSYRDELLYVLVPRIDRPIGVVAANILDTANTSVEVDSTTIVRDGVVGTAIVNGRLTLFLDLFRVVELAQPGWVGRARSTGRAARRVLLVEDSAFYAALVIPQLRKAGLDVVHAVNGAEGLQRLASEQVDVVISDIEMPVMDGFELARRARADRKLAGLPMIAMSAMHDETVVGKAHKAGFNAFESKRDQHTLIDRLLSFCTGGEER